MLNRFFNSFYTFLTMDNSHEEDNDDNSALDYSSEMPFDIIMCGLVTLMIAVILILQIAR